MLTLADLRRRARSRLNDTKEDYRWTDEDLLDYINDAIRDAAVRANFVVEDEFAVIFELTAPLATTYKAKYPLPSGILDVKRVYLNSLPSNYLRRLSFRQLEQTQHRRPTTTELGTPWAFALDQTQPGVDADEGVQVRTITFIDNPKAADTAYLSVVRLPALLKKDKDVPEFDEIWHPFLLDGILGYAYQKNDPDTYDEKRAAAHMAAFEASFGDRLPAVTLRERQTDVPREMILG